MKKVVNFLIFILLTMFVDNGYSSQDHEKFFKPGYIGAAAGLTAFTASAIMHRMASNNQQSPYATIAFSAIAAALCAVPAYCTTQYFTNKLDLLAKDNEKLDREKIELAKKVDAHPEEMRKAIAEVENQDNIARSILQQTYQIKLDAQIAKRADVEEKLQIARSYESFNFQELCGKLQDRDDKLKKSRCRYCCFVQTKE